MSEKIKLKISPAVAVYVRPGTSSEIRLAGCAAAAGMLPFERVTLLFCLSKDSESSVKLAAIEQLELLPEDVIAAYLDSTDAHPSILEALSRISLARSLILETLSGRPDLSNKPDGIAEKFDEDEPASEGNGESLKVEDEEFLSKYKMAQIMGIGEKIKMALTGDKEWRSLLVKDANKLVSAGVIKNPRITEAEVLAMIKGGIQNDEIMRLICANREWIKNYSIRKALIANNRTPIQNAMRYLETMGEKDLASFAKSKNISSVISTMAKRILLNKKR
ncbi:MAG: hypothetical protein PHD54_01005 [Desulfuromonadaceae bacterium]|nr:hypothetical protein [Desulfuromonadaceae bacterium]